MYKVIVIDDEMLVRRGIVMETDWQGLNCVVVAEAGCLLRRLPWVLLREPWVLPWEQREPLLLRVLR